MTTPVGRLHASAVAADRLYVVLAWLAGAIGFTLPLSIVGYLLVEGAGRLSWDFFCSCRPWATRSAVSAESRW